MRPAPGGWAEGDVDVEERGDGAELASVVAHDANNVLAPMVLAVEQLRALDLPHVTEHIDLIAEGCRRLSSMLRLLLPATGTAGPQRIDVNTVVRDLAGMLQTLAGPGTSLCLRLHEPLESVIADRLELERAMLNLVANARDAMPRGGEIVLSTASVHLPPGHATGLCEGDWVLIELQDHGEGMDAATSARAFEPFFTTKPSGLGTGLGPTSVKRAMSAASGVVRLRSEVGKGTSVALWLPAAPQRA
jgi:signal transduction histidine kinase